MSEKIKISPFLHQVEEMFSARKKRKEEGDSSLLATLSRGSGHMRFHLLRRTIQIRVSYPERRALGLVPFPPPPSLDSPLPLSLHSNLASHFSGIKNVSLVSFARVFQVERQLQIYSVDLQKLCFIIIYSIFSRAVTGNVGPPGQLLIIRLLFNPSQFKII